MANIYTSYSNKEKFALFSCAMTILWKYVPIDSGGRIPLLLMAVSTMLLAKDFFKRRNRTILIYFILTIYVFINALLKGSAVNFDKNGVYMIFVTIFRAPMVMLSMTILFRKNFDKTLKYVTYIFLLFAFCALVFGSKDETYDGRYSGGSVAINELALYMTCCIDCLILQYVRGQRNLIKVILFAIIPFALLLLTASKTGMIMLVMFVLGTIAVFFNKRNIKHSLVAIGVLIVFLFSMNYIMDHTKMGERLSMVTSEAEGLPIETGTVLDHFGDRGAQYYFSWPYFLKAKWTGIGFLNWGKIDPTGHIVHSDYLYAYLENGIIGFCLYLFFIVSLFKCAKKKRFIKLSQMRNTLCFETSKSRMKILAKRRFLEQVKKNKTDCGETTRKMARLLDNKKTIQNRTRILLIVFLISVLAAASATRIYSQPEIFIFYAMILALPYSGCYSKV